jgi:hypothetical protein
MFIHVLRSLFLGKRKQQIAVACNDIHVTTAKEFHIEKGKPFESYRDLESSDSDMDAAIEREYMEVFDGPIINSNECIDTRICSEINSLAITTVFGQSIPPEQTLNHTSTCEVMKNDDILEK